MGGCIKLTQSVNGSNEWLGSYGTRSLTVVYTPASGLGGWHHDARFYLHQETAFRQVPSLVILSFEYMFSYSLWLLCNSSGPHDSLIRVVTNQN